MSKKRSMSVSVQLSVEWSGTFEVEVPAGLTDDQIADCLESMDGDDIKNLMDGSEDRFDLYHNNGQVTTIKATNYSGIEDEYVETDFIEVYDDPDFHASNSEEE